MKILQDIKTAVTAFGLARKARKAGADGVWIRMMHTVPCVTVAPAYLNTVEGNLTWKLGRDTDQAVMEVFNALPYDAQRWLNFTPSGPDGWVQRARFWQRELMPALPSKMYHKVMALFIGWYGRCLRRKGATV